MYFFEDIEKQKELEKVLKSWLNTPYRHWCGVKGLGADCIHFVIRVLEEVKFFQHPVKIPRYDKDWHLHRGDELLLRGIIGSNRFKDISDQEPINGDLILFQYGRAVSHVAIYYNLGLYQSFNRYGVRCFNWRDVNWYKRKTHIFRPLS